MDSPNIPFTKCTAEPDGLCLHFEDEATAIKALPGNGDTYGLWERRGNRLVLRTSREDQPGASPTEAGLAGD